jgi:hypothetical protein
MGKIHYVKADFTKYCCTAYKAYTLPSTNFVLENQNWTLMLSVVAEKIENYSDKLLHVHSVSQFSQQLPTPS